MRIPLLAANWKMNKTLPETEHFFKEFLNNLGTVKNKDILICPPFTALATVAELIKNSPVQLGAQNMHFEDSGAFTGEISADMLKSCGCHYVILGHSERRHVFHESDDFINKKMKKALEKNISPILCVGEKLEERENDAAFHVVKKQIEKGLSGLNSQMMKKVIIAYEPVWAIGTGKTATPAQAQEMHAYIRRNLSELFDQNTSKETRILYGGSIKPRNIKELMEQPDIDGGLIGGASLETVSFLQIIRYD